MALELLPLLCTFENSTACCKVRSVIWEVDKAIYLSRDVGSISNLEGHDTSRALFS